MVVFYVLFLLFLDTPEGFTHKRILRVDLKYPTSG